MEAKKGQDNLESLNEKIFLQHRQLANNETDREIERKVEQVDVENKKHE